ncbi:MAG: amidohydrolase family protein [Cyclobacteriaceae bacterium]
MLFNTAIAQEENGPAILRPEWVFDGTDIHRDWTVVIDGNTILFAGPSNRMDEAYDSYPEKQFPGSTLMPGLIEGHSHLLLYPYNERSWNDQVLRESPELRSIRGAKNAEISLKKGITTMRDLGSEGAGYADIAIRNAIENGIIEGPDLIVAGPALVATGSYGPKGFHPGVNVPLGAEEADGVEGVKIAVRRQIGNGIDFVKVYADYRWGPDGSAQPTFSLEELKSIVEAAKSTGRYVVAHASTEEGIRRAVLAGVETIEHGDELNEELLQLMKENDVALCPTLGAVEAISRYSGYDPATDNIPERLILKRSSFKKALESGVRIVFGGDVGVFPHGENAWELELMVDYGMDEKDALHAATSGNADVFHLSDRGKIANGYRADLIIVKGDPTRDITLCREPEAVMKNGRWIIE